MFSKPKRSASTGRSSSFATERRSRLSRPRGREALLFPFPEKRVELLIDEDLYRLDVGEADGFGGLSEEEGKLPEMEGSHPRGSRSTATTRGRPALPLQPRSRNQEGVQVALKNRRISGVKPWLFHIYDSLREDSLHSPSW